MATADCKRCVPVYRVCVGRSCTVLYTRMSNPSCPIVVRLFSPRLDAFQGERPSMTSGWEDEHARSCRQKGEPVYAAMFVGASSLADSV